MNIKQPQSAFSALALACRRRTRADRLWPNRRQVLAQVAGSTLCRIQAGAALGR